MQPKLAQVLNTVAHEIRTPLAVSQGYLKLYIDGRLTSPDDQQRALQQTREALGVIATICVDMGKVSAVAARSEPLTDHVSVGDFVAQLRADGAVSNAQWIGGEKLYGSIATNNSRDLVKAVAVVLKAAFDDARESARVLQLDGDETQLTLLAGANDAVPALRAGSKADAHDFDIERGGKGMNLIWASLVLDQHHVGIWKHRDHRASVGLRFPLEQL